MTGGLRRLDRLAREGVSILMYHRILPDEECADHPTPGLVVSASAFRQQVEWLARRAEVLPVAEALEGSGRGAAGSRPIFCITFDDGYRDNLEVAAPILRASGLRASFYVTTGPVAEPGLMWTDEALLAFEQVAGDVRRGALAEAGGEPGAAERRAPWTRAMRGLSPDVRGRLLARVRPAAGYRGEDRFRMMSADDVRKLAAAGHEVGSHTVRHAPLTGLDDATLHAEIAGARATLEGWLGQPVPGFCYPRGDHDDRVVRAARAAGHEYALTTEPGLNGAGADRFRLRRRGIKMTRVVGPGGRPSRLAFRCECNGYHDRLREKRSG